MRTNILLALLACCLGGCTDIQIKHDTRSFATTIAPTYENVMLENLALFMNNFSQMPSLADLTMGHIEATESFSPSVTIPFGNTVATTVVGTPGTTITAPSRAFTLAGSIGTSVTLGVSPVVDAIRLRNTAAIFRYILIDELEPTAKDRLRRSYHYPTKAGKNGNTIIDDAYLRPPQCVLCYKGHETRPIDISNEAILTDQNHTYINPELQRGWLRKERKSETDYYLGRYGGHELWETNTAYWNGFLANLVMILLPAKQPASAS